MSVVADSTERAQSLAAGLSESDRLEIVDAGPFGVEKEADFPGAVDVTVAIGLAEGEIRRIRGPVVAITDAESSEPFGVNVRAWLPVGVPVAEIEAAVTAAAHDLLVLTGEQSRRWLRRNQLGSEQTYVEALTQRELQVLGMLADGLGNKEIAGELGISDHTAKFHVSQILAKLGVTSRAEAVATGMRRGLVPI